MSRSQNHALQSDRRRTVRKPIAIEARIRLEGGVFLACKVRDISTMGAGLELDFEAFLPLQFRLQIPGDLFEVECVLRHRRGTAVGVEFTSARAEAMARYG